MPNSVAEAYMLIVRSSLIPVLGEAIPFPFNQQIELDSWEWDLKPEEGQGATAGSAAAAGAAGAAHGAVAALRSGSDTSTTGPSRPAVAVEASPFGGDNFIRRLQQLQVNPRYTQEERDRRVRQMIQRAIDEQATAQEAQQNGGEGTGSTGDHELTFKFKKNFDFASTQLLYSLAQGEVMPRAVVTLFHRSVNAPVTLIITFGTIRLKTYTLQVDPGDAMTDITEEWTASYETVDYAYQNRPSAGGPSGVAQALTQGTARIFKMAPRRGGSGVF
jgi:type VI protein secretion system component Hcp